MIKVIISRIRKQGVMNTEIYNYLQEMIGTPLEVCAIDVSTDNDYILNLTVRLPEGFASTVAVLFLYSQAIDALVTINDTPVFKINWDNDERRSVCEVLV